MKVLIGVKSSDEHEYCINRFLDAVKNLGADILFVHDGVKLNKTLEKHGTVIVSKEDYRNVIGKHAKGKYDYVLFLLPEILVPANVLDKLLARKTDVVSGLYLTGSQLGQIVPAVYAFGPTKETISYIPVDSVMHDEFVEVASCGLGCCLVATEVLSKINFNNKTEFGNEIRIQGKHVYADTSVKCVRMEKTGDVDWPVTIVGLKFTYDTGFEFSN